MFVEPTPPAMHRVSAEGDELRSLPTPDVLVLGGGGPVGLAWHLGWLEEGAALLGPDVRVIGTSAGAIAGALLLLGPQHRQAIAAGLRAASEQAARGQAAAPVTVVRGPEVEAALAACAGGGLTAIVALGRLMSQYPDDGLHTEQVRQMVGEDWPAGDLTVVTRSASTGERKSFSGEVPLPLAVAASSAAPGRSRPVTIDREDYIDGGIGSILNADLARGASPAWVLAPAGLGPSASELARGYLERELAALDASGTRVQVFTPEGDFTNPSTFADAGRAMDDGARVARAQLRRP